MLSIVPACRYTVLTTIFISAATPTDCLLDNSRVVSIAMSFGFTVFVLVYVAAAFSGKLLLLAITIHSITYSLGCGAICDSSDTLTTTLCAHVQHVLFSFDVVHPAVLLGSAAITEAHQYLAQPSINFAPYHACMRCEGVTIVVVDYSYQACMQYGELCVSAAICLNAYLKSCMRQQPDKSYTLYYCR